jgi:hypothetical protein
LLVVCIPPGAVLPLFGQPQKREIEHAQLRAMSCLFVYRKLQYPYIDIIVLCVADASITLDLMKIMLSYIFKKEMHQQPKGGEVHLTTPSGALIIVVLASFR